MAYFDHIAESRKKESLEKFEELKKFITSKDENGILNEWYLAYEHIKILEENIKTQDELIKNYQKFFIHLNNIINSLKNNDIIG